uniref:Uncharacterized protein n=1 Tax=Glossina palpalis gambiensis TaxID=67801 RepID=A0A1B0BGF5_9MUSC
MFSTNALGCVQNDCVTASMKHIPTRRRVTVAVGASKQFVLFIPSSPSSLLITQTRQQRISGGKVQKRISEQGTFSSEAKQFEILLP